MNKYGSGDEAYRLQQEENKSYELSKVKDHEENEETAAMKDDAPESLDMNRNGVYSGQIFYYCSKIFQSEPDDVLKVKKPPFHHFLYENLLAAPTAVKYFHIVLKYFSSIWSRRCFRSLRNSISQRCFWKHAAPIP